ncbi:hypothetical protein CTI12_AA607160 [Artemisia annua]|uniref:Uncharacterized protein n=1 Tax=Artemisia annua TaxID=35608 RepID=A0A2U1KG49_ARTAN|nr:hypothetical protein CTI12_AA607160 [Artemisia annua]
MESVNEASQLLERKFITINGVKVKVTEQEGSEVWEGKHKLVIRNMDYRSIRRERVKG